MLSISLANTSSPGMGAAVTGAEGRLPGGFGRAGASADKPDGSVECGAWFRCCCCAAADAEAEADAALLLLLLLLLLLPVAAMAAASVAARPAAAASPCCCRTALSAWASCPRCVCTCLTMCGHENCSATSSK